MMSEEQRSRRKAALVAAGVAAAALVVVLAPIEAQAQAAAAVGGTLDTIVDRFKQATSQWEGAIKKAAISLFWILAAIEFAVMALFLALAGGGFQNLAAEIVKRILVVGIFFFILDQGTAIVDAVIQSFRQLSSSAGGAGFKPSDIFNAGVSVAQKLADNVSFWQDTTKSLALLIAALVVVVCFALIAAIVIVTTVEMYIVTYAGIILLGFGGSAFTKDYAVKYLTYAISVGLKLMVMGLVVGIGQSIITATAQGFQNKSNTEVYIVVGVAIVLLAVTKALPAMLQSIVVGSSVGSNTTLPAAIGAVAAPAISAAGAVAGAALGAGAVANAALKGQGSLGQRAGNAVRAVAGAAYDRAAGVPGSRFGSIMGNAASQLRQQNQQASRLALPPTASGGRSTASGGAQSPAVSGGAAPSLAGRSGGSGSIGFGGSNPAGLSPSRSSAPSANDPGGAQDAGGGPADSSTSAFASPTVAGSSGPGAPTFQAASSGRAATQAGATQPGSEGDAAPGTKPRAAAPATPAAPPSGRVSISTGRSAAQVAGSGSSAASAMVPAALDTNASNAAASPPVPAGGEAVPATSGTTSGHDLDGRSAGTAQTINQAARAATSTGDPSSTRTEPASDRAAGTTYVSSVPLSSWRVPSSKPTKPTSTRT